MSALTKELLNSGPLDPLRLNVKDLIDRVAIGLNNDLIKRNMRNAANYSIRVELVFNLYEHKTHLVLSVIDNESETTDLSLRGDTVEELLSEENRAMLYLLMGS